MPYLRNVWYVAGHAEEAGATPFARTYLDEPVLIYRGESGELAAMDDRCPHRFAPLHKGKVVGDAIQCPYHGLRFDGTGACVRVPSGADAPPRARLKTYPIAERHSLLWIWMGEPAEADPGLIPDLSDCDGPGVAWFTGTMHCKANYQLLVDNLLDLSHAEFLHPFLSSDGWAGRAKQTVSHERNQITVTNVLEDDNILPVMAHFKPHLGKIGKTIYSERWDAPSLIRLSVDYHSGDDFILIPSLHMLTPETERSTHYFLRGGQTVDIDNPEITEANRVGVLAVFQTEDIPLIEAQQAYMGDAELLDLHPAILTSDQGAIMARRRLAKLIREQGTPGVIAAE